jgi:hypothetical protein
MMGLITVFVIFFSAKNNKKDFEKGAKENKQAFKIEKQEF